MSCPPLFALPDEPHEADTEADEENSKNGNADLAGSTYRGVDYSLVGVCRTDQEDRKKPRRELDHCTPHLHMVPACAVMALDETEVAEID